MTPRRAWKDEDFGALLALIRGAFAFMEGRIDPPSSMHRLTEADIARQAVDGEVWVIGPSGAPMACVFLTCRAEALYIGKLAVAQDARGKGLGRALIDVAAARAVALGYDALELQTRIELEENQRYFGRQGFVEVGRTAHPGYDRPTSITYRKPLEGTARA